MVSFKNNKFKGAHSGFTLIEILVVTAIFLVITLAISYTYNRTIMVLSLNKMKIDAIDLANEQIEIIHNLPYADVGIVGGIPNGKIDNEIITQRDGSAYLLKTTIRNTDDPADGTVGGTPNDLSPADYKLVEVEVSCDTAKIVAQSTTTSRCSQFHPVVLTTIIAPKALETASTNGALFVKVFDANGIAVSGADVHIVNPYGTSTITIDDVTDVNGLLQIIDAPPGTNAYTISVTKSGFSTDQTSATSMSPYKPPATVITQQVTQISFAIDRLSTVTYNTVNAQCLPQGNVPLKITSSKLIAAGKPKSTSTITTNAGGVYTANNIEWDTYAITPGSSTYDILGINPISPINVLPGSTQSVTVITALQNPNTVLMVVKDAGTGLPLSDAVVDITGPSGSFSLQTGRGFVRQTDWSGGGGQTDWTSQNQFYSSAGINYSGTPGQIKLQTSLTSGNLISSVIDMSTSTDFKQILWNPTNQPVQTGTSSVQMQIATSDTNNGTTTWNYVGPDGTAGTYFMVGTNDINAAQSGKQYFRYKVFLSSNSSSYTPNVADISVTFTSACVPPGQVLFDGLTAGTYSYTITRSGYTTQSGSMTVSSGWQTISVPVASL